MIISVDTKHDSHEDIKKVIDMLRHLVGEKQLMTNSPEAAPLLEMASVMNQVQEQQSKESIPQEPDFTDLFSNMTVDDAAKEPQTSAKQTSSEDPFSDLLSADDLPDEEEEDEESASTKKPKIELY